MPTTTYRLLGIDDEQTTCDLCGKADLKCTMVLEALDADGNGSGEVRFGRDCGARALGWRVSAARAERFVKGTARLDYWTLHTANAAHVAAHGGQQVGAARIDIDGVTIEIWDAFYGRLPIGTWMRPDKHTRLYWRAVA